jgi:hypothetical protein
MLRRPVIFILALSTALCAGAKGADSLPTFLETHCLDCHDETSEAGVNLEKLQLAGWSGHQTQRTWERVLRALREGAMPPQKSERGPSTTEHDAAITAIHESLIEGSKSTSGVLRRLNRAEYENSIRAIFGIPFQTPEGFPEDTIAHGFDNTSAGLVFSPPLMEGYFQAAIQVADTLFPPPAKPVAPKRTVIPADSLVISYSSGAIIDGAMRLAARTDTMWRSSTWPTRFEADTSGKYRLKISASRFAPGTKAWPEFPEPMMLRVLARSLESPDGDPVSKLRKLAEFEVNSESPESFEFIAELHPAETPVFYFANAPLNGDSDKAGKTQFEQALRDMFARDERLLAGWLGVQHASGLRGGLGWDRVKKIRDSKDLDLSKVDMSAKAVDDLVKKMVKNPGLYVETVIFQFFEEGPALEIHEVEVQGPMERIEGPQDRQRRQWVARFMGEAKSEDRQAQVRAVMQSFLTKVFRRPAEERDIAQYTDLTLRHADRTGDLNSGLHLAIRTALMSPHFLYRGHHKGALDDFDLAARLSYFLTNAPPDQRLYQLAATGQIPQRKRLATETRRLLKSSVSGPFVASFTGQWLHTRQLEDIMPDVRLIPSFKAEHRADMIAETELFFAHMIEKNLPLRTFANPDFTFMNKRLAETIYNRSDIKDKSQKLKRVALKPESPFGGVLGFAGVMMATANGLDTQPVERGVWALRNVLGDPPPEPPDNVPALTPDTRGSKTVRDLLQAHQADANCATCHRKIDPVGFALENFDPIGRWRTHYPKYATDANGKTITKNGAPVSAASTLPDGTEIRDVRDLKTHLETRIDRFAFCLGEKLLTYATGHPPNFAQREEIREIVKRFADEDGGFQDFIVALVKSETFRTK